MPLNISKASDAWLMGSSRFEQWKAKFEQEWHQPVLEMQVLAMWESLSDEGKAVFKGEYPELYELLVSRPGG
jgi:hypothetical protein